MRYFISGLIIPLAMVLILKSAGVLVYAKASSPTMRTFCFEAESGAIPKKSSYKIMSLQSNMDTVSGGKVVVILPSEQGKRTSEGTITYRLLLPETNTYYLWARVFWTTGCGNSLMVSFDTLQDRWLMLGGDNLFNTFHWVTPSDAGNNQQYPLPLHLTKGSVKFSVGSKVSGIMCDQFLLTTDPGLRPNGIYLPTPGVLYTGK